MSGELIATDVFAHGVNIRWSIGVGQSQGSNSDGVGGSH